MKRVSILLVALSAVLVQTPATVLAEHEANHPYTVRGYVLDANEEPIANAPVVIDFESVRLGFTPVHATNKSTIARTSMGHSNGSASCTRPPKAAGLAAGSLAYVEAFVVIVDRKRHEKQ